MSNHIVLLSGLGSSLLPWRYKRWANELEGRLKRSDALPKDTIIWNLSSDGTGEKPALKGILADLRAGKLGRLAIGGHSNGARDALFMIETLFQMHVPVQYAFSLDMTLGEFGAEAYGNIKYLDEFHARLQHVDFDDSFVKSAANYHYWQIDKGHVAMASDQFVQQRLRQKIEEAMTL